MEDDERWLPIANVGRIMKQILPPGAKISREAKQTMQECATEFISFVTGEASDKCQKQGRKTLSGDDVCWTLGNVGLEDYADAMEKYLNRFRKAEKGKEKPSRSSKKEERSSRRKKPT